MIIGERLRSLREEKKLSQGDIEHRTGLLRCYVSRVENGHTVPSIETLEKLARALELPLYQLLYEGNEPPEPSSPPLQMNSENAPWGSFGKHKRYLRRLTHLMSKMGSDDREILLFTLEKIVQKRKGRKHP